MKFLAIAAAMAILVVACGEAKKAPSTASATRQRAIVVRAVDGDTIKVKVRGEEKYVRLIGIDTPETHKPGVKVECGGPEASAKMRELAPAGGKATLTYDSTQDKVDRYGRLLAYVRVNGESLQLEQLYAGNAEVYVYGGKPFSRVELFRRAERVAKGAHRGVWGHCNGDFHSNQETN